MPTRQDVTH